MDLSGKLIIKVQLGDDIRRIPIHNEDITYDELVLMMQRVYRGNLSSSDDILIKYKDEDGDLVTIFDSTDLSFAIQCSRILKLTLIVNGKLQTEPFNIRHIRQELQSIRNIVNSILDKSEGATSGAGDSGSVDVNNDTDMDIQALSPSNRPQGQAAAMKPVQANSKEFDPISIQPAAMDNTLHKVAASFGLPNDAAASGRVQDRPGTPDSSSSIGSASQRHDQQLAARQAASYTTNYLSQPQIQSVQPTQTYAQAPQTGYSSIPLAKQGPQPGYDASTYPYAPQQQGTQPQQQGTQPQQQGTQPQQQGTQPQQFAPPSNPQDTQQVASQQSPVTAVSNQNYSAAVGQSYGANPQAYTGPPPPAVYTSATPQQQQQHAQSQQASYQQQAQNYGMYAQQQQPQSQQQPQQQPQLPPQQLPQQPPQQQHPSPAGTPIPGQTGTAGNPYSRGPATGYGMSYARPTGSYQQGYR